MSHDKTARMANQIAAFFASKPHDEGVAGVAEHINKFWEPRMRARLFVIFESEPDVLHELVRAAMPSIRPVPAESVGG
ncbi:formate dehydrogenase subunit delta [Aquibium sp. LZ166]|uniref:Formate dehydrogenase subunit delta n=1 Tax=Aquibium pacificus TaxID=3153579 RepID=A0ABV3SPZ4_9HYPH